MVQGASKKSQVLTLAERASRFCMIIALPYGRSADSPPLRSPLE
jgi:hypothetical protein